VLPWGGIKQTTRDVDVASWNQGQKPSDVDSWVPDKVKSEIPIDGTTFFADKPGEKAEDHITKRVEDVQDSDGVWREHLIAKITYRYNFQSASLNIGVLFVLAALSLAVYGVVIGGWASNNKYSFLGGLRATANMISYEIPLGLAVLCVVVVFGTLNLEDLVNKQAYGIFSWNIWSQPFAFVMFLVCIHAEANRAPFDMAEAEQELVGGYHTEYSAMRFALFFLGEYAGMITTSVVCIALFFGGWQFPGVDRLTTWIVNLCITHGHLPSELARWDPQNPAVTNSLVVCIVRALVLFTKTIAVIFVFMWVRWSLPRFRFDQLMNLAWRGLIPISLALLMVTAIIVYIFGGAPDPGQALPARTIIALGLTNVAMLVVSVVVGAKLPAIGTNRKMKIPNSRFTKTPLPAGVSVASNN
jgi:NADH-quinone oxidoreductase subunit H